MKAGNTNRKRKKKLTGRLVIKTFGKGSKSEHDAVYLDTEKGSYILRRIGANPFHDPFLHNLIGKKVTATGIIDQYQFLATEVNVED